MSRAQSMAMMDAAQPMPDRLTVRMSDRNLKWRTIRALSDGTGANAEQLTIRASIYREHTSRAFSRKFSFVPFFSLVPCMCMMWLL